MQDCTWHFLIRQLTCPEIPLSPSMKVAGFPESNHPVSTATGTTGEEKSGPSRILDGLVVEGCLRATSNTARDYVMTIAQIRPPPSDLELFFPVLGRARPPLGAVAAAAAGAAFFLGPLFGSAPAGLRRLNGSTPGASGWQTRFRILVSQ